ncbi:hypothetical protein GQ43DRAFT_402394 [Delitschia confertaspora ATCC 74209]|uniref:Uncharacterized protein n=1 Tax=Delitschia confertaspora ATCC 74209 TaxID=1513339 RepID=A0A9P4JJB3_9PLEO|nr:hypothetical protein GQ43DRAFT_402394 [Delitschia confertaspora ATCC 74209]
MNVEPPFQLKQTNVSRPQLVHSDSQQSIAASEDYYSVSEKPSSTSDDRSKTAVPRYHTPPSRIITPGQSHDQLQEAANTVTYLRGAGRARQHLEPPQAARGNSADAGDNSHSSGGTAVSTILQDYMERPPEEIGQQPPEMERPSPSTTPGVDETPYIRFAIDQLTRDEEVRGSRHYPVSNIEEEERSEEDYPVERVVSDEGLGYMAQEEKDHQRLSRPPASKPPMNPTVVESAPVRTTKSTARNTDRSVQPDIFIPFKPEPHSYQHSPLRFRPAILRPLWLGLFILLCLLMLGALMFCAIYSHRTGIIGLWDYKAFGDSRYFVFEYLPTMLGMIILMWLFQVKTALQRTIPFISMASESTLQRSEAVFLQLYPMQFILPKVEYFRAGQPLIGLCYIIFWLFTWTIPLLASVFNVRYDLDRAQWRWIAVRGVIWAVIALYILLILALIFVMVYLLRKETGLKWDPRSLADIIALLERSNIMTDYDGSETLSKVQFKERLANRTDRIGYWHTSKRPNDIFYGFGEAGGATRRYSIVDGKIREQTLEKSSKATPVSGGDFSIRMDIRSPNVRLKYLPWYLKDTSIVAWIVTAVVLFIAFLVVSFLNRAIRSGFLPQVSAPTTSSGWSASNFLYSFVPAAIAHILFLAMLSLDHSIRTLQPYMSLSQKGGSTAESSLLVDYACRFPISVTFAALENRHFQTAILSLVSLASLALPVLAGGCFWTQYYQSAGKVRVSADMPAYYALCVFLALYIIGLFALIPKRRRAALPHRSNSLAEIISWLYQSQILADRTFNRPQTKAELVARLMGKGYLDRTWMSSLGSLIKLSRDNLKDTENLLTVEQITSGKSSKGDAKTTTEFDPAGIKYGFGIHVGRDGLEHIGIDRVRRGGGRELVIFEEQQKSTGKSNV